MSKQITSQEANTLVQGLKQELAHYQAAGNDQEKAQEHFQKAERYRQLLLQYNQQRTQQEGSQTEDPSITQAINSMPSRPLTPLTASSINQPLPNASLEKKISQLKVTFQEVRARIDSLEELKRKETDPEVIANYDRELVKLKPTFNKIANILSNQRILSPAPETRGQPTGGRSNSQSPPPIAANPNYRNLPIPQLRVQPPRAAAVRAPTAILVARPVSTQITPLVSSSSIPGRGVLSTTPLGNYYSQPNSQIRQLPMYHMSDYYSGYQGDLLGRMLQKRKLQEVVNLLSVDEGDVNTINRGGNMMDGDVEDLLIDLADEFVTQVTSFACKLAKHRKVDLIDMRDMQLNLERNWGIRVPGYNLDEIKATRKWQPLADYQERQLQVDHAKKGGSDKK